MQIIAQHPKAAHFLLPVCRQQGAFRLGQSNGRRGLIRVNPEILCQLLCRLEAAQTKEPCHKVDHIAGGPAAEAVKILLIQLHAGMPVIVEWAAAHPTAIDLQAVMLRCIPHMNRLLHQLKQRHFRSLPSEK